MTTALHDAEARDVAALPDRPGTRRIRIALLGFGRIGSALADLVDSNPVLDGTQVAITGALGRSERQAGRGRGFTVTTDPSVLFGSRPDAVVEVLGGLEPARTLVLTALARRVPVVTANKALVAAHGDELFAAATQFQTPLRCEAAVIAGVPFLGAVAGRPLAANADGITGVLNGTTNFILSRIDAGAGAGHALSEAQRDGFAEPDATADLDGSDAAAKLAILVRHFARLSIDPADVPRASIAGLDPGDLARARELGGRLKPVAFARWAGNGVTCFSGPAFLDAADPLAALAGVANGLRVERPGLDALYFIGPGAGPAVTAATLLDDVVEAVDDRRVAPLGALPRAAVCPLARCGWYVSLRGPVLPDALDLADLLGAYGVWVRRWGVVHDEAGASTCSLLTLPCDRHELQLGLRAVAGAASCSTRALPIVEAASA